MSLCAPTLPCSKPARRFDAGLPAIFLGFRRFESDSGRGQATAINFGSRMRL